MQTDIAMAGGGLAGAITALRLLARPDPPRILMFDPAPLEGRTWSFHEHDVSEDDRRWLSAAVAHEWPGQDVRFPDYRRQLRAAYSTITPAHLTAALQHPSLTIHVAKVRSLARDHLVLEDGTRVQARCVIDARGIQPHPALDLAFQKFWGKRWS